MLIFINLKIIDYHLAILTKWLLLFFQINNNNQNYKKKIDFIIIFKKS